MGLLRSAVRKPGTPHLVRACLLADSFDFEETGAPNYYTDLDLVDASVDCIENGATPTEDEGRYPEPLRGAAPSPQE